MPSKPAAIDHVGMVGCDLLKEGGFRVRDEQAEALLEVAGFRRRVRGLRASCPARRA